MNCKRCGAELENNARFCPACGALQPMICPACGAESRPGSRECSACGRKLPLAERESKLVYTKRKKHTGAIIGTVIGVLCALLLLGGAYLLLRRVITPRIPLAFVGTVFVLSLLTAGNNDPLIWATAQILSGGVLLGAIFMATDYVTSPVSKWGQVIFGIGIGVITVAIRGFGSYPEGVSYAILVMNACATILDKVGRPKLFGTPKKEAAGK